MTKLEHFERSQHAVERSAWRSQTSLTRCDDSQDMIRQSIQLMDALRQMPATAGSQTK